MWFFWAFVAGDLTEIIHEESEMDEGDACEKTDVAVIKGWEERRSKVVLFTKFERISEHLLEKLVQTPKRTASVLASKVKTQVYASELFCTDSVTSLQPWWKQKISCTIGTVGDV